MSWSRSLAASIATVGCCFSFFLSFLAFREKRSCENTLRRRGERHSFCLSALSQLRARVLLLSLDRRALRSPRAKNNTVRLSRWAHHLEVKRRTIKRQREKEGKQREENRQSRRARDVLLFLGLRPEGSGREKGAPSFPFASFSQIIEFAEREKESTQDSLI